MKSSSIKEIKNELDYLHPGRLKELCLHLAKYKKENKELLTYLLFESSDELNYIQDIETQMDVMFKEINKSNSYLIKKSIRKILRTIQKYIKYSGSKQTEVELLISFCINFKNLGVPLYANSILGNIYMKQVQKIQKSLLTLHEDLQYDYSEKMRLL